MLSTAYWIESLLCSEHGHLLKRVAKSDAAEPAAQRPRAVDTLGSVLNVKLLNATRWLTDYIDTAFVFIVRNQYSSDVLVLFT